MVVRQTSSTPICRTLRRGPGALWLAPATFELGRDVIALGGGYTIGLYSPERSIVDAYRLRHLEGDELGREALKAWLWRRGSQPSRLLEVAAPFPKALGRLREDMRLLL